MNGEMAITIRDLWLDRIKGGTRFVCTVPRFDAAPGEFVAVTGPSGCGKSTFLDLLALVLTPAAARRFTLTFAGTGPIDALAATTNDAILSQLRRRHIGYVLQTGGLLPFITVRDNIRLPLVLSGRDDTGAAEALAGELGLADQLGKMPAQLSGGQRQRVAIARALIHAPDLILADEPTAAVDRPTAMDIMLRLRSLARDRRTLVILVTHDIKLADKVADRQIHFRLFRHGNDTRAELVRDI